MTQRNRREGFVQQALKRNVVGMHRVAATRVFFDAATKGC
jgi:hypothetical protein